MKKRVGPKQRVQANAKKKTASPSRDYIHALRGKFRSNVLLKALMAEKKREREL